jgi:sugar transferase EpsL
MHRWGKRLLDVCVALLGLAILSPLIALIALAIRLTLGSPVLFRQVRAGYKGKPFVMLKFRNMTMELDAQGRLLPDGERITKVGRVLRQFSLDELPQLWNVLRGEMSLVGPRPLLVDYLPRYTPEQARRHEVRPGISGWAQVNGRNALSWGEKFRLDVWYVDHQSLGLDLRILTLTGWKALRRESIDQPGQATAEEFLGSAGRSSALPGANSQS